MIPSLALVASVHNVWSTSRSAVHRFKIIKEFGQAPNERIFLAEAEGRLYDTPTPCLFLTDQCVLLGMRLKDRALILLSRRHWNQIFMKQRPLSEDLRDQPQSSTPHTLDAVMDLSLVQKINILQEQICRRWISIRRPQSILSSIVKLYQDSQPYACSAGESETPDTHQVADQVISLRELATTIPRGHTKDSFCSVDTYTDLAHMLYALADHIQNDGDKFIIVDDREVAKNLLQNIFREESLPLTNLENIPDPRQNAIDDFYSGFLKRIKIYTTRDFKLDLAASRPKICAGL